MAVIYSHRHEGRRWAHALRDCEIPCASARQRGQAQSFASDDSIKPVTMHSSKGLEFPFVILPDFGALPRPEASEAADAGLLYVAMTRATEQLLMLHYRESAFTRRTRASIGDVEEELAMTVRQATRS